MISSAELSHLIRTRGLALAPVPIQPWQVYASGYSAFEILLQP